MPQTDYSYTPFTDIQKTVFEELMIAEEIVSERYQPRIFPGVIAVPGSLLDEAASLSLLFQRATQECFARAQCDTTFLQQLLRPFQEHAALREAIATTQFFMEFYRIDFYVDPETRALSIIEVNTSPGSLPEHACIDTFLSGIADTTPPKGMKKACADDVLLAFDRYLKRVGKKDIRTVGFIIREEGSFACLPDARMNARALQKHFPYTPVFCTLDKGTVLELFRDEPQPIDDIRDLDVLYVNPGSSLKNRNIFTEWLKKEDITLLPPRSNLLFTNKSFLTTLREKIDSLHSLTVEERLTLKNALIPSFALADLDAHLHDLQEWEGVVVKRDLGSSGVNVHVFSDMKKHPEAVMMQLRTLKQESEAQGETWTVQAYRTPSSVLMNGEETFFEVMVYTVLTPEPAIIFATRTFQGEKANTHFGAQYGNLCRRKI